MRCLGHLGCLAVVVDRGELVIWIASVLVWSWNLEFSCIRKGARTSVYMHSRRFDGRLVLLCAKITFIRRAQ